MKWYKHLFLLWLVTLLAIPQSMRAHLFEEAYRTSSFIVTPKEQGALHLKVLYLDQYSFLANNYLKKTDGDFPNGAWIYAVEENGNRHYLFSIYHTNDQSVKDNYAYVIMQSATLNEGNGVVLLKNHFDVKSETVDGVTYDGKLLTNGEKSYKVNKPSSATPAYVEIDWYYPPQLAGKTLKIMISGDVRHASPINYEFGGSPVLTSNAPSLYVGDAVYTPFGENMGYFSVPVSNDSGSELKLSKIIELDENGAEKTDITSQCKSDSLGMCILIPSTGYTHKVKIKAQVPYSKYLYMDLPEKTVTLNAFHNPKDFQLKLESAKMGSNKMSWTVPYYNDEDALSSDVFFIERKVKGLDDSWTNVGQIVMKKGQELYEFTDSTEGCTGDTLHHEVTYRLTRSTIGDTEGYYSTATISKYLNWGTIDSRMVNIYPKSNNTVEICWPHVGNGGDNIYTFWPENAQIIIERTSKYTKKGVLHTITEEFEMTPDKIKKNDWRDSYTDESLAPCTEYSYSFNIYPNHPAMKSFHKSFSETVVTKNDWNIESFTATIDTYQDHIHLNWTLALERMDDIILERRLKDTEDAWEKIKINQALLYYDDYNCRPGKDYEYRLTANYECESAKTTTATATGRRKASGKIAGFVTFSDGVGLNNVMIRLTQNLNGNSVSIDTCYTNAAGAYVFPDVPFSSEPYVLILESAVSSFDRINIPVFLNEDQNNQYDKNFICTGSFAFNGYVYYEQTTMPVVGASFTVDGQKVTDKNGNLIVTDNEGAFNFKVMRGAKTIKVHKKDHTFMYDGLYANNQGQAIEMTEPKSNVFFWDQTKIRMIGRVTGGLDQGEKPLGRGLSENNLGDDLRIVLEPEGNLRSWLVKDQLDETLRTKYDTLVHTLCAEDCSNTVTTERRRVIIYPNIVTGEYMADLLPIRYKIVEIKAEGYSTLFQKGNVAEIIDLSDSLKANVIVDNGHQLTYHAVYNRIYRVEPTITITERDEKGKDLPHFGLDTYPVQLGSTVTNLPLYDATTKTYAFGYPIMSLGKHYFHLAATENYYYNNNRSGDCDSVPLRGGRVKIYNDFAAEQNDTICELNEVNGSVDFATEMGNFTFDVSGENATRHLDVALEYDGSYINGASLRAYILGMEKVGDDIVSFDGALQVTGILRDPPGSKSYAWIDKGSIYENHFKFGFDINLGLSIGYETGKGSEFFTGSYAGGPNAGTILGGNNSTKTLWTVGPVNIPIIGVKYSTSGSTFFEMTNRIQTSDQPTENGVGTNADLIYGYDLGTATSIIKNVKIINDYTYKDMEEKGMFNDKEGVLHHIASGTINNVSYHLISDYGYAYGPVVKENFCYTRNYIVNTLIPKLKSIRNNFIFKGSREEAQAKATNTGENVFFSLRAEDDPRYCLENVDDTLGYISIDRYEELYDKLNYEIIPPMYVDVLGLRAQRAGATEFADSIHIINKRIAQWEYALGQYEYENVMVNKIVDALKRDSIKFSTGTPDNVKKGSKYYIENHALSGGVQISHSESFSTTGTKTKVNLPIFGADVLNWKESMWTSWVQKLVNGVVGTGTKTITSRLKWKPVDDETSGIIVKDTVTNIETPFSSDDLKDFSKLKSITDAIGNQNTTIVDAKGAYFKLTFKPLINAAITDWDKNTSTSTKTITGYVLETDADTHLDIDVYHDIKTTDTGISSETTTFSAGNFIYRVLGGTTKCPYYDGEKTQFFSPGTFYSAPTSQVEKPRISVDNHIINGVPYGQRAKFNLVLSNEGNLHEEGSFDLVMIDQSNQHGLSIYMDGAPLGNGRSLVVPYGTGMVKVLEIGCGQEYDYEDLKLILRSQCDNNIADTLNLSVHFTPSASPINVVSPADKWMLNTNSSSDKQGLYYMPVNIDGFDVNFRNFDHIELQYKQSSEAETRWTNLCSFYANDSLFAKGTGTKAMLNGSSINYAFYGDKDPVEMMYDLRAVTFSRLGNGFVTNSSPVFSGIKDTRRPQVFGSPQPTNSILTVDNDLKLVFSENIDANRLLNTNNFRVTGLPNSSDISSSTSVFLDGSENDILTSEAERNFAGESFSIDMMIKPNLKKIDKNSAYLFRHQAKTGQSLELFIKNTSSANLPVITAKFISDLNNADGTFEISSAPIDDINWNIFQRIVMTFDCETNQVHFYVNNRRVDAQVSNTVPFEFTGSGNFEFGKQYIGNMLECRIWTKALTIDEIASTNKTLYGYESGLCAYYPMNEGTGNTLTDQAQGVTLSMGKATWNTPDGYALTLNNKDNHSLALKGELFERTSEAKSYTLSFWFKDDKEDYDHAYLADGRVDTLEQNSEGKFFIGIKNKKLTLCNSKTSIVMEKSYCDNQWHQLTFVVDRTGNLASTYIDGRLTEQTAAVDFGRLFGNFFVGSCRYINKEGNPVNDLRMTSGSIDEITLWDMALPVNIIQDKMNVGCDGSETGLLAYIPFSEHVQQISGGGTQMEFSTNYYCNHWDTEAEKYVQVKKEAFLNPQDVVEDMRLSNIHAPIKEKGKIRDLRYNFITKDNELIIELAEPAKDVERTTVNITAMGIEDLNGNEMAQPVTWSAFIHRNTVRWKESSLDVELHDMDYDDVTFTMSITNYGGNTRNYEIEGIPSWMTAETGTTGTLDPEETRNLTFSISKDINVGVYNQVLYLRNDEGLVDPLKVKIVKKATAPNWSYDKSGQKNMQLCAQVKINNVIVSDKNCLIGAFNDEDKCLGIANITSDEHGKPMFYLTIYGKKEGQPLTFRMWYEPTGTTYVLKADKEFKYVADSIAGSYINPIMMNATLVVTQDIALAPIWTWVSFNVKSDKAGNVNNLLSKGTWQNGDQVKDPESQTFYDYINGTWRKSNNETKDTLTCDRMYYIKSKNEQTISIEGSPVTDKAQRTISIRDGWNYIGYTPTVNLTVAEALADFYSKANDGDVIKSQDEFATFNHTTGWKGNLKYMKPGKGYMLRHTAKKGEDNKVSFVYPSRYTENMALSNSPAMVEAPLMQNFCQTSMNMIVNVTGVEAQPGDRLMVYADGQLRGIAEGVTEDEKTLFYLSLGGEDNERLSFTLERDGELLGVTAQTDIYNGHTVEGTTDIPKVINFGSMADFEDGQWYTLNGMKLDKRPKRKGLYIFNRKKTVIR